MNNDFQHYLPLSAQMKKEVWDTGLIFLDANVLLDLYRMPEKERDKVMMVLMHADILKRVWVPHQAAEELFRNRLTVINEQVVNANKLRDALDKLVEQILKAHKDGFACLRGDGTYRQFRKRHPLIDKSRWEADIGQCFKDIDESVNKTARKLRSEYEEVKAKYDITIEADPLLPQIQGLLVERTGEALSAEDQAESIKEAKRRIEGRIPPGYKDKAKDAERPYGDYLVWKQMLLKAGGEKRHAVFVSNDHKEDWLLMIGGQAIGPRPELRQEFYAASGKEIEIATLERFTAWACKRYGLSIEDLKALDEAIREARQRTPPIAHSHSFNPQHVASLLKMVDVAAKPLMQQQALGKALAQSLMSSTEQLKEVQASLSSELLKPVAQRLQDIQKALAAPIKEYQDLIVDLQKAVIGNLPQANAPARQFTKEDKPAPEEMAEWFLEDYMDPANGVFYDSNEGGYQYVGSGPCDAQEVISEAFPEADEKDIEIAVKLVSQEGGPEWVLRDDY